MRRSDLKRVALVEAAAERFHHRGVNGASLADIARAADVRPGNMFYYYRTKEDLSRDVALHWSRRVSGMLLELDELSADPIDRVRLLVAQATSRGAAYADSGCPLAAIVRDFRQLGLEVSPAAEPLNLILEWLQRQFTGLGGQLALRRATFVLSALQGAFVLAHASGEAKPVTDVAETLDLWLDDQLRAGGRPRQLV